jgi:hypothetical protein
MDFVSIMLQRTFKVMEANCVKILEEWSKQSIIKNLKVR